MEVLSTTNPIPPTGGTNAVAPLGISASMSVTKSSELQSTQLTEMMSVPAPILIGEFSVSNQQNVGDNLFTWSTRDTTISTTNSYSQGYVPWNLIKPYYSKMVRMEYILIFKPYKVTDCEAKIHAIWTYDGSTPAYSTNVTANHGELFSFDDSSDQKILQVPQFFQSNNITTNETTLSATVSFVPKWVPYTTLQLKLANIYQPNLAQPDSFKVQVFILPIANNAKVISCRRMLRGGYVDNNQTINTFPYFY